MKSMRQLWMNIRYSFWFLPAVFVIVAVALAVTMIDLDGRLAPGALEPWPRLFGAGAEGARGLLATVAGSIITVAGVVFSITLVALTSASSQYTSRVLRNFMRDRSNQVALGTFVGIFAYCLVVMRTIRGGDVGVFVPSMAVLVGLLLGFFGIILLIWFIHHISISIQATYILAEVAVETLQAVDHLFPEGVGEEEPAAQPALGEPGQTWHFVRADKTGYIQTLNTAGLLTFATERRLIVRMERGIGQFVIEGTPIASVLGATPSEDDERQIRGFYSVGQQRTVEQDAAFGIRQIVDVALKAISPGVNDTTTAAMCLDRLTEIMIRLTDRRIESHYRGKDGQLRLVTRGPTYATMVADTFDEIRQNAAGNVTILMGLLDALALLAAKTLSESRQRVLREHARAVAELCRRSVPAPRDCQCLNARLGRLFELLGGDVGAGPAAASGRESSAPPAGDSPASGGD